MNRLNSLATRSKLAVAAMGVLLLVACESPANAQANATANWPQFRGADSRGVASSGNHPERWSATENVAWKRDLPGRGWSSPIVWGDRIFLTTVVNSAKSEEPKKGLYFGGDRPKPTDAVHQWKVYCLDLKTGEVRWERQVHAGKPETPIHLKSSYASETPVTDGERVYCCFGNVGVFCFDFDGKELWRHTLKPLANRLGWGTAASPVIHRDRIYLVNDNEEDSYLLALDAKSGTEVWRVARDEKSNWATPYIWQNARRTEIVTPGTGKVRSYDLEGKLLWSLTGMSSITIATPYEQNGLLYVSSGYVLDPLRPIYAIWPGAAGDISLKDGNSSNEFIAWSQSKAAPYNPSTLIHDDRLFVLYDRGLVAAFNSKTGSELFGQQRLPNGRAFTSSPWVCDGKLYCLSEDGVTFVLKSADQFELLHTNSLAEDDMCMATPAIAGDRLVVRTSARVYCIRSSTAVATTAQPAPKADNLVPVERSAKGAAADDDLGTHGYTKSGDVRIHYVTKGEGPLVVMIHGFPDYWYTWRRQMPALSEKFKVVAIDQRGFNESDQPVGVQNYALDKLVADVRAVIQHFQRDKAVVVGHDWGGMVAWSFAMTHPEMTERLVILNLPHPNGLRRELATNPEQQKNSAYARHFQRADAAAQLTAEGLSTWVRDVDARKKYVAAFQRSSFEGMLNYYKANYPREPYTAPTDVGPRVRCSVLVFHGLKDKALLPDALNGTWKWIDKDLTLVTVPDADHFIQQDAADLVTRTMVNWLQQ